MGDWRTLHLFDTDRYKTEVVPLIKDTTNYLPNFLTKQRSKWLDDFEISHEEIIKHIAKFISKLNLDLSIHQKLDDIQTRKIEESYQDYIKRSIDEFDQFRLSKQIIIEFYEFLMIETIFSTVSNFNPYFTLGKRLFESCIDAKNNSIAQEVINKIVSHEQGSILDLVDGGIINWLSKDEVELLLSDWDNLFPKNNNSHQYLSEFKSFLRLAYDHNLGVISLRNPNEEALTKLQNVPQNIS